MPDYVRTWTYDAARRCPGPRVIGGDHPSDLAGTCARCETPVVRPLYDGPWQHIYREYYLAQSQMHGYRLEQLVNLTAYDADSKVISRRTDKLDNWELEGVLRPFGPHDPRCPNPNSPRCLCGLPYPEFGRDNPSAAVILVQIMNRDVQDEFGHYLTSDGYLGHGFRLRWTRPTRKPPPKPAPTMTWEEVHEQLWAGRWMGSSRW